MTISGAWHRPNWVCPPEIRSVGHNQQRDAADDRDRVWTHMGAHTLVALDPTTGITRRGRSDPVGRVSYNFRDGSFASCKRLDAWVSARMLAADPVRGRTRKR